MDLVTLALAKGYTNKIAAGFKQVEIQGSNLIFTLNDGSKVSIAIPTPADGKNGLSVTNMAIDNDGSLLCYMSDGSVIDAGKVPAIETEYSYNDLKDRPFYFDEAKKEIFYENNALAPSESLYGDKVYYIGNYTNELDKFYPNGYVYLSVNGSPFYLGKGNDSGVDVGESVSYEFNDGTYKLSAPYGYYRLMLTGDKLNPSSEESVSVVIKTATEADTLKLMDGTLIDKGASADWNEEDKESVRYIHNKPFGLEKAPRTLLAKTTGYFPRDFSWKFSRDSLAAYMTNGKFLVLEVDGVDYGIGVSTGSTSYPCFEFDNGNFKLKYSSSSLDVYLDYFGSELDTAVSHIIKILTTTEKDNLRKIDKQYLPIDEILAENKTTFTAIADWSDDDPDSNIYIYNKPFGHFYNFGPTSGNSSELYTQILSYKLSSDQWYDMTQHHNYETEESDWLATLADNDKLKEYRWKVNFNGIEYNCQWTRANNFERDGNAVYLYFGEERKTFFQMGYIDGQYYDGIYVQLGGTESKLKEEKNITLSYNKYLYEEVVKIPDELMPATSRANWNEDNENSLAYIKNKPFGIKPWKSTTFIAEYSGEINTRDSVYQLRSTWGEYIWNNLFVTDDEGYTNFRDRQFLITINGEEYIGKFIKDENKTNYGYCYLGQCGIEGSYDYKITFEGYDQYQQYTDFTFSFGDGSYRKNVNLKVELIEDRFELCNNTNITLDGDSNFTDTTLISMMKELKNQDKLYNTPFYITIDGRVYDKTLLSSSDILYLKYRGKDKGSLEFSLTENTIGFYIDFYPKTENISIQIEGNKNEETVIKINEKYIPNTIATKEYVDDAIANIHIPEADLTNYYTKDEVTTALTDSNSSLMNMLSFVYGNTDNLTTPDSSNLVAAVNSVNSRINYLPLPKSHDGEGMIGWYNTAADGDNLTEAYGVTPDMVRAVKAGDKISWPSRTMTNATENTICLYNMTYTVYNKDEGDHLETIDIIIGKNPDSTYTYTIVGDNVYKNTF